MTDQAIGTDEGDICGRDGCTGVIKPEDVEDCSCHIAPPCSACVGAGLECPVCGWNSNDEE